MSYALVRDRKFVSTEANHNPAQLVPWPLLLCEDLETAWLSPTIEIALERSALLRMIWGLTTEIRAIR